MCQVRQIGLDLKLKSLHGGTLMIKVCPKTMSADFFTASAAAAQACTHVGMPDATESNLQK